MQGTIFGLDLAKRIFQLHWIDAQTGEICRRQLRRGQLVEFFANRAPGVIAMEACGGAHYWGRKLTEMGHEVRLIAAQRVRPFVQGNKNDAADAQGIWEAVQRPKMKFVALKSEAQQAILSLHRMREQLAKMRTMQVNQLRGLLAEFGADLPQGRQRGMERIPAELEQLAERLPAMVIEALRDQVARIASFDTDIAGIEEKLTLWMRENKAAKMLMAIPGVGLLTATAAVATIGDTAVFKNGREFAAFVGLVPRQHGTGGKVKLLGISKRGDVYLRTLLIHGARTVITHAKQREPWLEKLLARRPLNVAVVALANKMARTIWALLFHDRTYLRGYAARAA